MNKDEDYTEHMRDLRRRIAEFTKKEEEVEEDPWTEEAVRIVGEKIIARILAREKGTKK